MIALGRCSAALAEYHSILRTMAALHHCCGRQAKGLTPAACYAVYLSLDSVKDNARMVSYNVSQR